MINAMVGSSNHPSNVAVHTTACMLVCVCGICTTQWTTVRDAATCAARIEKIRRLSDYTTVNNYHSILLLSTHYLFSLSNFSLKTFAQNGPEIPQGTEEAIPGTEAIQKANISVCLHSNPIVLRN